MQWWVQQRVMSPLMYRGRRPRLRPKRRRISVIRIIIPALLLALAYFGIVRTVRWGSTWPLFEIQEIRWLGVHRLRQEDLAARLGPVVGQNIFQVSMGQMVDRLRKDPGVKGLTMRRELPNVLVISVRERVPAAVLSRGKRYFLVDEEGMVLEPVSLSKGSPPEVLQNFPEDIPRLEGEGTEDPESVQQGLSLIDFLGSEGKRLVKVEKNGDLLTQWEGVNVRWGWGAYPEKFRQLEQVMEDLKKRGETPEEVDLRFDHQVVVRR